MTSPYVICGVISFVILIYLFIAMLKPEWF
jgi:K+-transporting ATPase KdpF subunit